MITKSSNKLEQIDFDSGEVILIDKPSGWTSFKVVNKIRKTAGIKKAGHAGTLDPAATGLLIICTGRKTKEIYKFQELEKVYEGTITLGKSSPSMDLETEVTEEKPVENISSEKIFEVRDSFLGKIEQVPPMYSALKHNGKALYKLARRGQVVERKPREIEIYEFDIAGTSLPDISFKIRCSKGTYIRTIANDFGEKLGTGGLLSALRRTAIGEFSVNDAMLPDEFINRFIHS